MHINDVIHGFKINRIVEVAEVQATLYEMIHEKTKAKTIWLKRDDDNKTFSIAFKTTPIDDTGVFHILEHSVLNGSKKYPVKEPFVDLLKGSLQTFLNAMTYPDKTVYPVSSRNNQDFINLMRVYLDAVFNPLAIKSPNVFYQEGWHYELNDINQDPIYKGVVFNEMKGAFSSPDSIRSRLILHSLFPDNCYGYESGGDPEYITDLTFEQFCQTHEKYYSPSNSYIFLDGNLDIDNTLKIINDEYLCNYHDSNNNITINIQKPIIAETVKKEYEISKDSDPNSKAQIANAYVIGKFDDYEKIAAFSLISSVICGNNKSPLKKAILENKLGEDIYFYVQDGILQPFVEIDIINTDLNKKEEIEKTITSTLKQIIKDGLDRQEMEATLNQVEFKAKERDFGSTPKGLVFGLSALDSWLYDGDPINSLCIDKLYNFLREKLDTTYYTDLIEELILNSKHCATVLLEPSNTLGEEKIEKEKEKLKEISNKWNDSQKEELIEMNKKLLEWQSTPDSNTAKESLPKLHLKDLNKEPTQYPIEVSNYNDNEILIHNLDTNGISYITLFVKTNDLSLSQYSTLSQLLSFLGKLDTEKYDSLTLNRMIKSLLGDFSVSFSPANSYKDKSSRNYIRINFSCLHRNDNEAIDLIKEIIYHTNFSNTNSIREILKQNKYALEQGFTNAGHSLGLLRAGAYSSSSATISEYYSGFEGYKYLQNLDLHFDELANEFINDLKQLQNQLFIKQRYKLSVTSLDKDNVIKRLLDDAPNGQIGLDSIINPLGHRKEGIVVPSNVSFATKHLSFKDIKINNGAMQVISNILTYDYLWNEIRVKGGAYGCGERTNLHGSISFYSYRDPNPSNSLEVYKNTIDYLQDFINNKNDIENYIVGTTGDFDPLMSNKTSIRVTDLEYLYDSTYEDKKNIYTQILNTTLDDINNAIELFKKVNEVDNICVVGNKTAIEKCDLDNILYLDTN